MRLGIFIPIFFSVSLILFSFLFHHFVFLIVFRFSLICLAREYIVERGTLTPKNNLAQDFVYDF